MWVLEDYVMAPNTGCIENNDRYKSFEYYDTLDEAIRLCSSDKECYGVLDEGCNGGSDYFHCRIGIRDNKRDCVYKKAEIYGNNT